MNKERINLSIEEIEKKIARVDSDLHMIQGTGACMSINIVDINSGNMSELILSNVNNALLGLQELKAEVESLKSILKED